MARGAQDPGSRIHLDFGWWIRLQRTGPGDPDMGHERRMQRAVDDGQREWRNASLGLSRAGGAGAVLIT